MKAFETSKENNLNSSLPFFNNDWKQGFFDFQSEMETEHEHWSVLVRADSSSVNANGNNETVFPNPETYSNNEPSLLLREEVLPDATINDNSLDTNHLSDKESENNHSKRNSETIEPQNGNLTSANNNNILIASTENSGNELTESLHEHHENVKNDRVAESMTSPNTNPLNETENQSSTRPGFQPGSSVAEIGMHSVENRNIGIETLRNADNANFGERVSENNTEVVERNQNTTPVNFSERINPDLTASGNRGNELESPEQNGSFVTERAVASTGRQRVSDSDVSAEKLQTRENYNQVTEENSGDLINENSCRSEIDNIQELDLKAFAVDHMNLIVVDSMNSQLAIDTSANEKEAETNTNFNELTASVTAEFEKRILQVPILIGARSMGFLGIFLQKITGIQQLAQQIMAGGWSLFSGFTSMLITAISGVTTNAVGFISSATARVLSFINSIPLPDIPGINRLRDIVNSIISGVVGNIQQFFNHVLLLGSQSLVNGLNRFSAIISSTIERIVAASSFFVSILNLLVTRFMHTVHMFVIQMVTFMRSRFFAIVLPFVNRLKQIALRLIRGLKTLAKGEVMMNTNYHLLQLTILAAEIDADNSSAQEGRQQSKTHTALQIQALSESSRRTNRSIVAGYNSNLINQIATAFRSALGKVRAVSMAIWNIGLAMFNNVIILLTPFIAQAERIMVTAGTLLFGFLARLTGMFNEVFQTVFGFLYSTVGAVLRGIAATVTRVRDRIFERIRNFVFGD